VCVCVCEREREREINNTERLLTHVTLEDDDEIVSLCVSEELQMVIRLKRTAGHHQNAEPRVCVCEGVCVCQVTLPLFI